VDTASPPRYASMVDTMPVRNRPQEWRLNVLIGGTDERELAIVRKDMDDEPWLKESHCISNPAKYNILQSTEFGRLPTKRAALLAISGDQYQRGLVSSVALNDSYKIM